MPIPAAPNMTLVLPKIRRPERAITNVFQPRASSPAPKALQPSVNAPVIWSETFQVRSYEVGPDYTATTQTLMDYVQEAAGNHARVWNLDGGVEAGWVWVMLRFRLRVYKRPTWRSKVTIETWARGFIGVRAERCFRFVDEQGNVMAEGTSYWATIDLVRRRPLRPPSELTDLPISDRETPMLDERLIPAPPVSPIRQVEFYVRQSDLDVNRHVNNVCYLDWALEAVQTDYRNNHRLCEIDLAFKAESVHGDTIVSSVGPGENETLAHQLTRESDERVLALVRTWWV